MLGIRRQFDQLFDGYLSKESTWEFRVLMGKAIKERTWLRLQGRRKRVNFMVFRDCMNSIREQYLKK